MLRFVCMLPFFNPVLEVVTFRRCAWSVLGVFVAAFTLLRHECQDLLSPCDGMHACTDKTSVYTIIWKRFKGMKSGTT